MYLGKDEGGQEHRVRFTSELHLDDYFGWQQLEGLTVESVDGKPPSSGWRTLDPGQKSSTVQNTRGEGEEERRNGIVEAAERKRHEEREERDKAIEKANSYRANLVQASNALENLLEHPETNADWKAKVAKAEKTFDSEVAAIQSWPQEARPSNYENILEETRAMKKYHDHLKKVVAEKEADSDK